MLAANGIFEKNRLTRTVFWEFFLSFFIGWEKPKELKKCLGQNTGDPRPQDILLGQACVSKDRDF